MRPITIDLTIVLDDNLAAHEIKADDIATVRGEITEANDKAIAYRVVECEKHLDRVGQHYVIRGPSLNLVLRARGYTTQPGRTAHTKDVLDAETGVVVIEAKRAHEVWDWLKSKSLRDLHPNCGRNADWMGDAYHLGPSPTPNQTDGDYYIVDDEGPLMLVRRFYPEDHPDYDHEEQFVDIATSDDFGELVRRYTDEVLG